MKNTHMLRETC